MKIIGFVASPRREGNTAWLVNKILEGAKEQGAQTKSWYSSDLNIKPCQGCWSCKKGDRHCIINDDMQKIYKSLAQADALVLGSPIYMGQMSAQAKIFTDRLFAEFSPRFSPSFKGEDTTKKKLILLFDQGNPDPKLFRPYIDYTKRMFELLEFDVKNVPIITGMREKPACERSDLLPSMKKMGSSLILA
ncbi:MAG TPA: NADPH-dependent FMN reductase [Ruminococcaceae bacterium]|nr:NADPH-dependent FMN reductase [Oscillospiraceae bacterium]